MNDSVFQDLPKINPDELSPLVWAYIGDAVFELFIRQMLLSGGPARTNSLHREATGKVCAGFQAELVRLIEPHLTSDELEILKRGRNAKGGRVPAHAEVLTYRYSTAFEALVGYLYLCGRHTRLNQLLNQALALQGGVKDGAHGETTNH